MSVEVSEYIDVRAKAQELRCTLPEGFALLPRNFDTASDRSTLLYSGVTPTIRVLLREAGLGETRIDTIQEPIAEESKKFFEWAGLVVFVGASYITQNPNVMSITLNIVSNYLTDFFKGIPRPHHVKLDVVKEERHGDTYSYRKFHYEGDKDGLKELEELIR